MLGLVFKWYGQHFKGCQLDNMDQFLTIIDFASGEVLNFGLSSLTLRMGIYWI